MKLIFLHALPFDGRMWTKTVENMGSGVLAPNLFGLGDSIEAWADAVLKQAGTDELIVIGCSVGGSCALEIALAAPDQVAALVLVGAKAEVNPDPRMRDDAIRLLETHGVAAAWDRYWAPLFGHLTPASTIETAREWALEHDVRAIVNGVRSFHDRRDLSTFAASWARPLIGISGDRDTAPEPSKLRRLASGTNRSFHLVTDCGHYVNLEQPAVFDALLSGVIETLSS